MYKWYADATTFVKNQSNVERSVFLFGGILISRQDEVALNKAMMEIKKRYTSEAMPLKYDLEDVQEVYKRFDKLDDYKKLINSKDEWINAIINESMKYEYTIFIACFDESHTRVNPYLSSFLFSDALSRVGMNIFKKKLDHVQVIIDWPENSDSSPFDKEYWYAYHRGVNSIKKEFLAGPLKKSGFDQTLYYARRNHSNMLQLTDIILGATKDWIESELNGKEDLAKKEIVDIFHPKFYSYQGNILNYGLNVSNKDSNFKTELAELLSR